MNAVYKFVENGEEKYAYSHYGANYATGVVRFSEAHNFSELNHQSVTHCMTNLTYDGKYMPEANNGNKVFNVIEGLDDDTLNRFVECGLVTAQVVLDMDKNLYKYRVRQNNSAENIIIPLSEAVNTSRQKISRLEQKNEKWSITDLSSELKHEFMRIQKQYNYTMDIVVVQPGLPAEHVVLDVSEGRLKAMQRIVDGLIEPIHSISEPGMLAFGNEEARILEMEPNRRISGEQPVCGTFFICGDRDGDSCSLTQNQINKYLRKFKYPDRFSDDERKAAHECKILFHSFSSDKELLEFLTPPPRGRS